MKMFGSLNSESKLFLLISLKFLNAFFNLIKKRNISEYVRHHKVKQSPELTQIIAERSSSQQQFEASFQVVNTGKILTLGIFYLVGLVYDQNLPSYAR